MRQLEALASSRAVANTLIEPLPNGVNFYEAEIQAIAQARKSVIGWLTSSLKARLRSAWWPRLQSGRVPAWK